MKKTSQNKFENDFLWYIVGTLIPMSVSFVSSPIFTRHFSPAEYGDYTLVFITFNYLSILTLTWISSSFWRFYPKYKNTEKIRALYSSIFYLIFSSLILIFVFTIILYSGYSNVQIKRLIVFAFLNIITTEMLNIINIPLRYEGRARFYNTVNIIKSVASFSLLLILTFVYNQGIESFLISTSVVNFILIIAIVTLVKGQYWYRLPKPDFALIKEVFDYGKSGMLANVGLLILVNSDRYIIGIFNDKNSVGIYNQLYNIAQLSVASIINIFFAAINPSFLNVLENKKHEQNLITAKFYVLFSLILIPVTVYFSLFTKEICHIMLGERFRVGESFLPAIMFSSLLYGYTLFHEAKLKFNNRISKVVIGMLLAGLLNLALNFIVLPHHSFLYASLTTLVSYLFLFIFLFQFDDFRIRELFEYKNMYIRIALILGIETIIYFALKWQIGWKEIHIGLSIIEGLIFSAIYFILIYFSGSYKSLIKNLSLYHPI